MDAVGIVGSIFALIVLALWVTALVGVAKAKLDATPKAIWVLIIVIAPFIGAIAWFAIGSRNHRSELN